MMTERDRYLAQQVATASPAMLVAMLFDALVANANRAADMLAAGNGAGARAKLIKSQEIVLELRFSLNHDLGGELAANLDRLYEFVYHRLLEGSVSGSTGAVRDAISVAETVRDGWRSACLNAEALTAAP